MRIELDENFSKKLGEIVSYIAQDKISASIIFKDKLLESIRELSDFPFKYRNKPPN